MAKQSISEEFYGGVGNAVDDVRNKVEEALWGRAVTERGGEAPGREEAQEPQSSFGSLTREIDGWPQRSVEPQGLNGEALGPEPDAPQTPASGHLLEHGQVIDNGPAHWPEAHEADPSHAQRLEAEREHHDVDLDR